MCLRFSAFLFLRNFSHIPYLRPCLVGLGRISYRPDIVHAGHFLLLHPFLSGYLWGIPPLLFFFLLVYLCLVLLRLVELFLRYNFPFFGVSRMFKCGPSCVISCCVASPTLSCICLRRPHVSCHVLCMIMLLFCSGVCIRCVLAIFHSLYP